MSEVNKRLTDFNKDTMHLIICRSGARSLSVTKAMVGAGLQAVNLEGGTMAW